MGEFLNDNYNQIINSEIKATVLTNNLLELSNYDFSDSENYDDKFKEIKNELLNYMINNNHTIIKHIISSLALKDQDAIVSSIFHQMLIDMIHYTNFYIKDRDQKISSTLFLLPIKAKIKKEAKEIDIKGKIENETISNLKQIFKKHNIVGKGYDVSIGNKFYVGPLNAINAFLFMNYHLKVSVGLDIDNFFINENSKVRFDEDLYHMFFIPIALKTEIDGRNEDINPDSKFCAKIGKTKFNHLEYLDDIKNAFIENMGYEDIYDKELIELEVLEPNLFYDCLEDSYENMFKDILNSIIEKISTQNNGNVFQKYKYIFHKDVTILEMSDPQGSNEQPIMDRYEIELSSLAPRIDKDDELELIRRALESQGYSFEEYE